MIWGYPYFKKPPYHHGENMKPWNLPEPRGTQFPRHCASNVASRWLWTQLEGLALASHGVIFMRKITQRAPGEYWSVRVVTNGNYQYQDKTYCFINIHCCKIVMSISESNLLEVPTKYFWPVLTWCGNGASKHLEAPWNLAELQFRLDETHWLVVTLRELENHHS